MAFVLCTRKICIEIDFIAENKKNSLRNAILTGFIFFFSSEWKSNGWTQNSAHKSITPTLFSTQNNLTNGDKNASFSAINQSDLLKIKLTRYQLENIVTEVGEWVSEWVKKKSVDFIIIWINLHDLFSQKWYWPTVAKVTIER